MTKNDIAGRPVKVGDKVATMFDGKSHLVVAKVVRLTRIKIGVMNPEGNYCTKFTNQVSLVESAQ